LPEMFVRFRKYLFKNSMIILTASISNALFGFLFWWIAAIFYPATDVGLATAMISSYSFLIIITRFGLEYSMIRFSSSREFSRIFNSTTVISTLTMLAATVIFIIGVGALSPDLSSLQSGENAAIFLALAAVGSMQWMTSSSFLALKRLKEYLFQTLLLGLRVPLLLMFTAIGAIGILCSQLLAFAIVLAISMMILYKLGVKPGFSVDREFVAHSLKFSAGNYVSTLFFAAAPLILPVIAVNMAGAEQAAYYFIAYYVAAILLLIPNAISMSLFVDGSKGGDIKSLTRESIKDIYLLLIPASLVLFVIGEPLLRAIGSEYSDAGLSLLRVMILSNFVACPSFVFFAVARVRNQIKGLIITAGTIFAVLMVSSYLLAAEFGIIGFGYAWILSYSVGGIMVGAMAISGGNRDGEVKS